MEEITNQLEINPKHIHTQRENNYYVSWRSVEEIPRELGLMMSWIIGSWGGCRC
jgi:hypothetical protein